MWVSPGWEAAEPQGSCGASRGAGRVLGPQCRATARPETPHLGLVPGRGPALRGRRQQRLAVGSGRGCRRRVPAAARRGWRALRAARRLRGARGARGARLAGRSRRAGHRQETRALGGRSERRTADPGVRSRPPCGDRLIPRRRPAKSARGAGGDVAWEASSTRIRTSEIKMPHTSVQQNFPATSVAGEQHLSGTAVRIPRAPPTAPSDRGKRNLSSGI
ncbi:uncharacterized protein [Gorilla gorilla gorilla]|uniref:uncharacterized protein n=1 Tax=Gorilla gorilla gorilla TaxID=9595 RepID=UPI002445CE76|nr:uncharacterized protein LOC115931425 [Gorilla gorilla gorilla]